MTAEVSSSLVRVLSGHMEEQPQIHAGNSDILITKDLLGNLSKAKATTKDTDIEIKAAKVEAQRCSSSSSSSPKSPLSTEGSASPYGKGKNPLPNFLQDSKLQDLNFPPINLFEEMTTSLDLKLQSCSTPSRYQSVCTLDKVKYALERAEKETMKKHSSSPPPSPPPPALAATSSSSTPRMFAAACPGCFLYVVACNTNPRCPRCNSFVPSSLPMKKPRIDLNASF